MKKYLFYNYQELLKYSIDLVNGLQVLQQYRITHKNINPNNIFIKNDTLVLGCIGIDIKENITSDNDVINPIFYSSPEVLNETRIYTPGSDIFAVGCVLYELYTNRVPFYSNNDEEIRQNIINPHYKLPIVRHPVIIPMQDLIIEMLDRDYLSRITLIDVFNSIY